MFNSHRKWSQRQIDFQRVSKNSVCNAILSLDND
jgi:hypothetical protein